MTFVERRKKASVDRMKTVVSERGNTHALYRLVKDLLPKIINNT